MLQHMKGMARPYATLFALALVVAVVFAVVFKYRHNPAEMEGVKH